MDRMDGTEATLSDHSLWLRLLNARASLANDDALKRDVVRAGFPRDADFLRLADEYLRFLYLDRIMPGGATPSPDIRAIRGCHARRGDDHAAFCLALLGRLPAWEGMAAASSIGYADTLAAYRREFGEDPTLHWPRSPATVPFKAAWRASRGGRHETVVTRLTIGVILSLVALAVGIGTWPDGAGFLVSLALGLTGIGFMLASAAGWDSLHHVPRKPGTVRYATIHGIPFPMTGRGPDEGR